MDADIEAAVEQLEVAYKRVLLIVDSARQKGVTLQPVIDKDLQLIRVEVITDA